MSKEYTCFSLLLIFLSSNIFSQSSLVQDPALNNLVQYDNPKKTYSLINDFIKNK